MPTSIVKVYNARYGQWEENAEVVLGWDGFINLGMSRPSYTNREGIAVIEHSSKGEATIYVNGKKVGEMYTPGSSTIQING